MKDKILSDQGIFLNLINNVSRNLNINVNFLANNVFLLSKIMSKWNNVESRFAQQKVSYFNILQQKVCILAFCDKTV